LTTVALALALYAIVVLGVGALATRRASKDPAEYFLAGRGLGSVVLFMALFGTNCTAFVLIGIPGQAYRDGIATFFANAPAIALGVPWTFWLIGRPARRLGLALGALTPAELYARRLGSRAVGVLLFGVYTLYTLPYMVTAVQGASVALATATGGALSPTVAGTGVLAVALVYTSLGGMRATAWTNVVQGTLFLAFVVAALFVYANGVGGGLGGAWARASGRARARPSRRPAGRASAPHPSTPRLRAASAGPTSPRREGRRAPSARRAASMRRPRGSRPGSRRAAGRAWAGRRSAPRVRAS
jgi:Na+/proline symporter